LLLPSLGCLSISKRAEPFPMVFEGYSCGGRRVIIPLLFAANAGVDLHS
jgi:hypothetical protein